MLTRCVGRVVARRVCTRLGQQEHGISGLVANRLVEFPSNSCRYPFIDSSTSRERKQILTITSGGEGPSSKDREEDCEDSLELHFDTTNSRKTNRGSVQRVKRNDEVRLAPEQEKSTSKGGLSKPK